MSRRLLWLAVTTAVLSLAGGILWLDRRQARHGAPSLLAMPWGRAPGSRPATPRAGPPPPRATPPAAAGRIALVIDELGARPDVFEALVALKQPLTIGVLPGLPLSRRIAREGPRAGLEVLLQLPLEPYRFPEVDPGPGALLISMTPEDVARRTREHLASLPGAVGVMPHMGSRFTEDRPRMRALLEAVRGDGRFFLDSLSTQASVGYDLARVIGLPAVRRHLFLEPDNSEASLRRRLGEVEQWAARRGTVVAIGHGRPLTVRVLAEALLGWEARGFRLVPLSALVAQPAS